MSTDASGYGWGGVIHVASGYKVSREYWDAEEVDLNISTKAEC